MIAIKQTVIVEGKYDKIKLQSIIDANIMTTGGFGIYSDEKKRALIKGIAEKTGIIILTDSDSAGRRIRNFIKGFVEGCDDRVTNVYIPKIFGKERRKSAPSKENTLGVEGMGKELLLEVFKKFGVFETKEKTAEAKKITKADFYADGLSGGRDSSKRREWLSDRLGIPRMAPNALIECVNILLGFDEYRKIIKECDF